MPTNWLERIVPPSRAEARGCTVITWALFGNDESGLYGERDNWSYLPGNGEHTFGTALRWWLRNPFHNLGHHALAWNRETQFVIFEAPPFRGLYVRHPKKNWVSDGNQVQFILLPLFFSWRIDGWEGYAGWRESGELGLAFRRHS